MTTSKQTTNLKKRKTETRSQFIERVGKESYKEALENRPPTPAEIRRAEREAAKANDIAAAERFSEILELRKGGFSVDFIASQFHVQRQTIIKLINKHLAQLVSDNNDKHNELRELDLQRLDQLITAHWARRADPKSASIILAIIEKRSKLLGTNTQDARNPLNPNEDTAEQSDHDMTEALRAKLFG